MKKLLSLIAVFVLAAPLFAADLSLRVAAGSNARVDDSTLDIATLTAGDKVTLELVLENLDFTLAGFEILITFPSWLALMDTTDLVTDAPYVSPLTDVQQLPADINGANTATTLINPEGTGRIGGVITVPGSRPSTGDHILATLEFVAGVDFDIALAARTLATCISASESITAVLCTTGAADCPIFADENAADVTATNISDAGLTVAFNNTNTTNVKGDANADGSRTAGDVLPIVSCAIFGSANANCPLSGAEPEFTERIDVNCSGAATAGDALPGIQRALQLISRPTKGNLSDDFALDSEGVISINNMGRVGALSNMQLAVNGNVRFGDIELSKEAADAGWVLVSKMIANRGVFNYMLVNLKVENAVFPDFEIPYEVLSNDGKVAIRATEAFRCK